MKIKRWMVITGVLSLLAGSIALASCQSTASSGTITCTMEDCEGCDAENCTGDITTEEGCSQNCSGITYDCNGTDMNCSQFMCYGEVYNCMNQEDCGDCSWNCTGCITDCTASCVNDCTKENCQTHTDGANDGVIGAQNCSGKSYVNRELVKDVDYVINETPDVSNHKHLPNASADNAYNLELTFNFDITLNVICKNIEVQYIVQRIDTEINDFVEYETLTITYETREDFLEAMEKEVISIKNVPNEYNYISFYVSLGTITADVLE